MSVAAKTKSYSTVEKAEVQPPSEEPKEMAKETSNGLLSVETPSQVQYPPTSVPSKVPEPTLQPDVTTNYIRLEELVDEKEKKVPMTSMSHTQLPTWPPEVVAVELPKQPHVEDIPKSTSTIVVKNVGKPVVVAEPTSPSETKEMVIQDESQPVERPQEKTLKEEKSVKVEKKDEQTQNVWRREEPFKEDLDEEKEEGEITDSDEGSDESESKRTCPPLVQQGKMKVAITIHMHCGVRYQGITE